MKIETDITDTISTLRKIEHDLINSENRDFILKREITDGMLWLQRSFMEKLSVIPDITIDKNKARLHMIDCFEKDFPGLTASILWTGPIAAEIFNIRYKDWFLENKGVNPKYIEIEHESGITAFTYSFCYTDKNFWTYARQGNEYYKNISKRIDTPFKHKDIVKFIKKMKKIGYNLNVVRWSIQAEDEYNRRYCKDEENS